ncbi:helical backbone metal receptor [Denitromonas halophila]|uniref:ABC transporter substrate-binding protein n=1 Tax=Denitromonas halophila TaxID=1629404 RepID=A0A557QY91_9RHOO|nr:helical backbone metal receptor [Denitromonas halophila]TVO57871.1 ABC transporter substrate-binding protein [Denitromonas halophila]
MTSSVLPPTDAFGQHHAALGCNARIVSLVPSITELLCDLGLTDQLVGRTGFCIHPREALRRVPKVGGTKDVKLDRIRDLAPTHVIVNVDENPRPVAEALAAFVPNVVVTHPGVPEDNRGLYALMGHLFDCWPAAEALTAALDAALVEARAVGASLPAESVLYLIWREPWMTVSRETYIAATLATVGWHTLPREAAERYPSFDWQAPWLDGVQRVLLSTEPYRFQDKHVAEVTALCGRSVQLIDGEWTSWYGSRAVAGLRALAALRRALADARA